MTELHKDFLRLPIAHRALHDVTAGRPENSRAAIEAGIAAGYALEIDLQPSRDGQAMVFHDYELDRLTDESGPVRQRDADRLQAIGLCGGDEGIPTFADVLDLVAGRVPILVELKDQDRHMGETDGMLEAAVARDLAGYGGALAVMSFNPHMVRRMARLSPDFPRGIVSCAFRTGTCGELAEATRARLREIPDYDATRCSFISHNASDLDTPRVAELKAAGAVVLCWTIRSQAAEAEARRFADNITFEGYRAAIPA